MELLDNHSEIRLTPEQEVTALAERFSHQPGKVELRGHAGRELVVGDTSVMVHYDPETYDDTTIDVQVSTDAGKSDAPFYRAVISSEGVRIMQPGAGRQEVVTDPVRRKELLGGFATKLRTAIETVDQPAERSNVVSLLGRLAGRAQLDEAA